MRLQQTDEEASFTAGIVIVSVILIAANIHLVYFGIPVRDNINSLLCFLRFILCGITISADIFASVGLLIFGIRFIHIWIKNCIIWLSKGEKMPRSIHEWPRLGEDEPAKEQYHRDFVEVAKLYPRMRWYHVIILSIATDLFIKYIPVLYHFIRH